MTDFIADLDGFFCEKYANYDKLCVLPGYHMPKMQATRTDEFGRVFAYTLPSNTMRLALQENKVELLKELKTKIVDKSFSFSFQAIGLFKRIRNKFSKNAPYKLLAQTLQKYGVTPQAALEELTIDEEIWRGICKGKYAATKNTLFSLALTSHFSIEDTARLMAAYGYTVQYTSEKDVVICYLLWNKVYSRAMIEAAFAEYKVSNLFMK